MQNFELLAHPLWVNLLIFVPFASFLYFRINRLQIPKPRLGVVALFGTAFGFVEATVVVYLRGILGNLSQPAYQQSAVLSSLNKFLLTTEFYREAATMVMLVTVAVLAARSAKERFAAFIWAFAFWDIFYYVWLYVLVGWPPSLTTPDVLFLIPVPWFGQVWFPVLVSLLSIVAVYVNDL